jgi:hypothetical protein
MGTKPKAKATRRAVKGKREDTPTPLSWASPASRTFLLEPLHVTIGAASTRATSLVAISDSVLASEAIDVHDILRAVQLAFADGDVAAVAKLGATARTYLGERHLNALARLESSTDQPALATRVGDVLVPEGAFVPMAGTSRQRSALIAGRMGAYELMLFDPKEERRATPDEVAKAYAASILCEVTAAHGWVRSYLLEAGVHVVPTEDDRARIARAVQKVAENAKPSKPTLDVAERAFRAGLRAYARANGADKGFRSRLQKLIEQALWEIGQPGTPKA